MCSVVIHIMAVFSYVVIVLNGLHQLNLYKYLSMQFETELKTILFVLIV